MQRSSVEVYDGTDATPLGGLSFELHRSTEVSNGGYHSEQPEIPVGANASSFSSLDSGLCSVGTRNRSLVVRTGERPLLHSGARRCDLCAHQRQCLQRILGFQEWLGFQNRAHSL